MRRILALVAVTLTAAGLLAPPAPAQEPRFQTFADGLDFVTNMAFARDGRLFFTEKGGQVRIIENGRVRSRPFAAVPVTATAEAGLLGIALHPRFPDAPWVYLYSSGEDGRNRLLRIRADGNRGSRPRTVLDLLPVNAYHNGGDIAFGPDGRLYIIVGESHDQDRAQNPDDVGGKVLRLNDDGTVPRDNPFGSDNPVFSMGHRNSFGLCFDPRTGNLWETENGPESNDEINLIRPGGHYGWPQLMGSGGAPEFIDPEIVFPQVIVPTGCAFYPHAHLGKRARGTLFFGDFQGTLHQARLRPNRAGVLRDREYASGLPGITDVQVGPDERLYVSTAESIVRLPRRIPKQEEPPEEEPESPSPRAAIPPAGPEDGGAPWVPWAVAGGIAAVAIPGLALLARRLGR